MIFTHPLDVKQLKKIPTLRKGLLLRRTKLMALSLKGSDGIVLSFDFRRNVSDFYFWPEEGVSFSL